MIKTVKPKNFQVKLDKVGMDSLNGGYKIMKDTSAMKLANKVCLVISKDFVGEKNQGQFIYELAIHLLAQIDTDKPVDYEADIKHFKELGIQGWELNTNKWRMTEEIKQLFKEYVKTHSPQECAELQGNLTAMMLIKASNNPKWVFK